MKFQFLSLAGALLSLSAASPISLIINLEATPSASNTGLNSFVDEICLPLCLSPDAEPDMPKIRSGSGGIPRQLDDCWTCCRSDASAATIEAPKPKSVQKKLSSVVAPLGDDWVNPPHTDLCLRVSIPSQDIAENVCRDDLVPVKLSENSWTCCQKAPGASSMMLEL